MSLISISEINKLMYVQQGLEKSISSVTEHLKKFTFDENIPKLPQHLEQEREKERIGLKLDIKQIVDSISAKSNFLKSGEILSDENLKQFKSEMIAIQDSIQFLKQHCLGKLKTLDVEFVDYNQDVDYYIEKMVEWSQSNNKNSVNFINYKAPNFKLQCVETREFIDFVRRSGGHENGWSKEDHLLFIKYRNKYKNIEIVAKMLNDVLPDKEINEIKQHEEWYKEYLILLNNKKEAVKKWQETKKKIKTLSLLPEKKRMFTKLNNNPKDLKDQLLRWKMEKEMKLQLSQSLEHEISIKKKELEGMKKKKNEEVKKIVEEWKKTKTLMEQEELTRRKILEETEKKRKAAEANKLIKQFQSQDDYYILKMKQHKKSVQNLEPIRSKSSQLAPRDPVRLLKPTQQWINRVHDENVYPVELVIPLKNLPKLGIPAWRRNVNK